MPGWRTRLFRPCTLALVLATLATVAGCAGSAGQPAAGSATTGSATTGGARVTVMAKSLPAVGQVLVTSGGYALYMFQPDNRRAMTCSVVCAGTWPPLKLPSGATLVAGPGVRQALLGSDPDPSGGRVITYNGWPLYTYTGDVEPGQATGQAVDLNGGEWYVLRPSGSPLVSLP